ncbi:MAG: hypothetical protein NC350_01115 [Corallococcus sp.]|nr:hypothetical protein [Corallococcus sp.]
MRTTAKFEKVSKNQYIEACGRLDACNIYDSITLPKRATAASAGYDFFAPYEFTLQAGETVTVPTGIRALMPSNWVLLIYPRSGLGFKYRLKLNNTVGVIDADYSNSDNEGHIFVRITNEGDKPLTVAQNTGFAQGIFTQYFLTEDDDATDLRNGGLGSTTKCS